MTKKNCSNYKCSRTLHGFNITNCIMSIRSEVNPQHHFVIKSDQGFKYHHDQYGTGIDSMYQNWHFHKKWTTGTHQQVGALLSVHCYGTIWMVRTDIHAFSIQTPISVPISCKMLLVMIVLPCSGGFWIHATDALSNSQKKQVASHKSL